MAQGRYTVASALRRSYLAAGGAAVMAVVLSLGAVLGLFDADVAVEGSVVLGVVVALFYGLIRSGWSQRFADPSLTAWQIGLLFTYLAYLTFRTGDAPAVVSLLYALTMLYGVLRLDPARLGWLAGFAIVAHGTALFMLIDRGEKLDLAEAWTQFGALALTLFGFAFAAQAVQRLRDKLDDANGKLHQLAEEARERASRDELTGAYHRRHLLDALEREVSRAQRTGKPLSIARTDVDRMRQLNEALGFPAGDAILRQFAQVAFRVVRDVDVFGRYGGSEFLQIMPDTSLEGAAIGGERLRAAVLAERFPATKDGLKVTCSSGLAVYQSGEDVADFLGRAEACLAYAMAAGGDRVVALHEEKKAVGA